MMAITYKELQLYRKQRANLYRLEKMLEAFDPQICLARYFLMVMLSGRACKSR